MLEILTVTLPGLDRYGVSTHRGDIAGFQRHVGHIKRRMKVGSIRIATLAVAKIQIAQAIGEIVPGYEKYVPPLMSTLVPVTKLDSDEAR